MNLFLCFCWTFCVAASLHDRSLGYTPEWFMVILPCATLALDNFFDWLGKEVDKYMEDHPDDK